MVETIEVIASTLSTVSAILIFLGFTKLGRLKLFHFITGEFAMVTALAFGFLAALQMYPNVWISAIWGLASSVKFATAMIMDD